MRGVCAGLALATVACAAQVQLWLAPPEVKSEVSWPERKLGRRHTTTTPHVVLSYQALPWDTGKYARGAPATEQSRAYVTTLCHAARSATARDLLRALPPGDRPALQALRPTRTSFLRAGVPG